MPHEPAPAAADFHDAVTRLQLKLDGPTLATAASRVGPVTLDGQLAFLKVTNEPEELAGALALESWDGNGAVRVLAHDGNAFLMERGGRTVRAAVPDDGAAAAVLCAVVARLHEHSPADLEGFVSLRHWFGSLFCDVTPRFDRLRTIADKLLDRAGPVVLLHGDIHHENVLELRRGGQLHWLAIDAKGIVGPREFDYCNIFTNWTRSDAVRYFDIRVASVSRLADIDRTQLLRWIACWSALSGIWHLEDGNTGAAAFPHAVMDLALDRLSRIG
ncbi:MAG: hypothetical protein M3Y77_22680 [Actinomycetota bacterium]|nr:hypothetical protein [Actinomycetota bacterium]